MNPRDVLSSSYLADINATLPKQRPVPVYNPEYLSNTVERNLKITALSDVWITFVHEGAGDQNSLFYYAYNKNTPPATPNDIDSLIAVFPNVSFSGSGGGMTSGDKVKIGRFGADTVIGFAISSNGYMLGRSCVAHTPSGTSAITNTKTCTFDWTAPATISTTPVKFYVSINSTDNDNSTSGDQPYTKTFSATVMPVKWLDFSASRLGDIINLKWRTASEINNSHFEVEHSIDGEKWLNVGKVKGYGNSNTINNYTFTYNYLTNNKAYFRLKQVNFNGTFEYSKN